MPNVYRLKTIFMIAFIDADVKDGFVFCLICFAMFARMIDATFELSAEVILGLMK